MNLQPGDEEHMRQLFVAVRMECSGNLIEIYNSIDKIYPLPLPVEEMVDLELETEHQMLVPIIETRKIVEKIHTTDRVLFISDMYLPDEFIHKCLVEHGFFKEGDKVFVNDTVGAWKRDGSLYRFIHEKEGIPYHQWNHYGDNIKSDVLVPRKFGIHSHHLHYDYLSYEKNWVNKPTIHFQYTSIIAGISRATRLSSPSPEYQKDFVCDISAPLMVSWVLKIMADAYSHNIKRLFFFARDAHSAFLISKQLQPLYPSLETRYLFISRQSRDRDLDMLLQYLKQEGMASTTEHVAFVDICSTGTSHAIINKLLISNGYLPCTSYCLQHANIYTINKTDNTGIRNEIMSFYTNKIGLPSMKKITNRFLPEIVFPLNLHLRTTGYCKRGEYIRPVFGKDRVEEILVSDYKNLKKSNDQLLTSFAEAFVSTGCHKYTDYIIERIAMPTFGHFTINPSRPYINYLRHFIHNGKPVVAPLNPVNVIRHNYNWLRGSLALSLPHCISENLHTSFFSKMVFKLMKLVKTIVSN